MLLCVSYPLAVLNMHELCVLSEYSICLDLVIKPATLKSWDYPWMDSTKVRLGFGFRCGRLGSATRCLAWLFWQPVSHCLPCAVLLPAVGCRLAAPFVCMCHSATFYDTICWSFIFIFFCILYFYFYVGIIRILISQILNIVAGSYEHVYAQNLPTFYWGSPSYVFLACRLRSPTHFWARLKSDLCVRRQLW